MMGTNQAQNTISDYAAKTICHQARKLVGRPGITRSDVNDIEQELTLDLLEHLPKFDSRRASLDTFSARVIESKASKILRFRMAGMRDCRREECALCELVGEGDGDIDALADTVDRDASDIRLGKRHRTREDEAHMRLDVAAVLSGLPDDLRDLAEHLKDETMTDAAKSLDIPRSSLYEMRNRLRAIFMDAALKDYLR